ncbi:MAG: PQQ-binding-like beta-propeller repeat protein [Acidimicrobiales bacterium]
MGKPRWWVDPASSGQPVPGSPVEGMLTFRGNPTRSLTGRGPSPRSPSVVWTYPQPGALCGTSVDGGVAAVWCGTGWTGQPALWRWPTTTSSPAANPWADRWLVAFGAFDGAVHLLDAETGRALLEPFPTGDLIKGSVTVDPDGYPLLYVGSRDSHLRILAIEPDGFRELWRLGADAVSPTLWNDDWDGSPLVIGDLLLEGGENSQFHVVRLNRRFGADGKVAVAPRLVFNAPGWDDELLEQVGTNVSIESSVAMSSSTAYFANSGGLVQGWDLAAIAAGTRGSAARNFRFWMGDDTDATVVIDETGALYVAAEYERANDRSQQVGQLAKLNPAKADDPLVWSVPLRTGGVPSGVWATPALHRDLVIVATNAGEINAFERDSGQERWRLELPGPTWSSPVVVDDVLIQGDCDGVLHAYDVADTSAAPRQLWALRLGGCIESTPAVAGGYIVVGTRSGQVFALADPATSAAPAEPTPR